MDTSSVLGDSAFFVGRETFLHHLHATLRRERRVVLTGRGGVGKTAIAREYMRRFEQEYQCVCWLNMATDETLLADLFTALQALSLPINMTLGISGLFQSLHKYLFTQQNFLLILDHPPAQFRLQDPPEQQPMAGQLLVIARSCNASTEVPCLEVTGLDAEDGALLVLRRAKMLAADAALDQAAEEQRLAALELARELQGLPIVLHLAGGHIRATGCSIQDYLASYRNYCPRLSLPSASGNEQSPEIVITCELSLMHLEETMQAVLERLQVAALLLPEAIPGAMFEQVTEETPYSDEGKSDPQSTMQSLLACGLLTVGPEASMLSMHPLVQGAICQFFALDEQKQKQRVAQALHLFQQLLPTLDTATLPTRLRVAGQIRHLARLSETQECFSLEAAEVFNWAASLLLEQGLVGTAEPLLRRALTIWEHTLGSDHPRVAAILGDLSSLNSLLKNYAEAEALAHRAIASKSKVLGVNHPDVILALDHLGRVYAAQGKRQEARLCYQKAISIGDQVGLRRHTAYHTVKYDLAMLCIAQKQFEQAESLLRRICLVWEHTLGAQNPSTMAARFSLAEVSARLNNWERAETCYRQALPVCEQLLGKEHPVTLNHLERAAIVFLNQGDLVEAQHSLQRVLEVREQTLGDQHPSIARCLNGLARVALAREQLAEALALLERAQSIYACQQEPDALALAEALDTLASVEAAQQYIDQAITVSRRALNLRRSVLGQEDLDLVTNLSSLAALYLMREEPQQAEPLLLQALTIYQSAEKPEDLVLDPVINSLAEIEMGRQRFVMAKMYLERSRTIRAGVLGQADPRVVEIGEKLAGIANA